MARFGDARKSLRVTAARGTIINATFLIGLNLLSAVKGFTVAALLSVSDYGLFGFLGAVLGSVFWLKQVGIPDKYVQQDEGNDEVAFQKAFTLEVIANGLLLVVLLAAIPLLAALYDLDKIVLPGLVLATAIPAAVLQTPLWIFVRRMEFLKQRTLQAIVPVVSFVVTIALAIAGFGYWSLIIGLVAGNWVAAVACLVASPYRLRFRFDRRTAQQYFSFSWPMFIAGVSILAMAQVPILVATKVLGLEAVGAIALASLIPVYARQASDLVTQTMYPGVCAVKDRPDLMLEAFTKSNRLGILWGVPVGIGLVLFAPDLVHFVLGEKWEFATRLLQAMGLITAMNQFGFNWTAFYQALGRTRPIATAHVIQAVAICGITVPLMAAHGLDGFAVGMGIAIAIYLVVRTYYLTRLFPAFSMLRHSLRAVVPTLVAAAAVVAVRVPLTGERTVETALVELFVYFVTVIAVTVLTERDLLREAIGYVRNRARPQPMPA
ncbi:MAG: oligosaccharide flippase family protein [Solirubrobacterales bacterium]